MRSYFCFNSNEIFSPYSPFNTLFAEEPNESHRTKMHTKNIIIKNHCFVLTGGPDAGKTTVLDELKRRGFICEDEVAREIIRHQVKIGGSALPWSNVLAYKQIMLDKTIEQFINQSSDPAKVCFFDRGIPDIVSYSRIINAPIEKYLDDAGRHYRYNRQVFIFPPWKEI
jgi:predicted ATPase